MLRRDAIALLLAAAAPAPRRAVILLTFATRRVLTAQNSELLAPPGSTLKPLVFSTLLRAKKLDPGEAFPWHGAARDRRAASIVRIPPMKPGDRLADGAGVFVQRVHGARAERFEPGELARGWSVSKSAGQQAAAHA